MNILKIIDSNSNIKCEFNSLNVVNSTGLVGLWSFDSLITNSSGTYVKDESGNGNYGRLNDSNSTNLDGFTLPQLVKSKLGNALKFDGLDDYVNFGSIFKNNYYGNFSVFIEIKPRSYGKGKDNIFSKIDSLNSSIIFGQYNFPNNTNYNYNNTIWYEFRDNGDLNFFNFYDLLDYNSSKNKININEEYNIISLKNGLSNKVYINGYFNNNNFSLQHANFINNKPFLAGTGFGNTTYGDFYNGLIDEIRIYNRTLSNKEIDSLYFYSINNLKSGINTIDVSSCNLSKGKSYNIVGFTSNSKLEMSVIAK